jgi:hypothetical protein
VRLPALDAGDKSNAARIMLMLRPVQALRWWQTPKWIDFLHVRQSLRFRGDKPQEAANFLSAAMFFFSVRAE